MRYVGLKAVRTIKEFGKIVGYKSTYKNQLGFYTLFSVYKYKLFENINYLKKPTKEIKWNNKNFLINAKEERNRGKVRKGQMGEINSHGQLGLVV
jgi:hypothetical protein